MKTRYMFGLAFVTLHLNGPSAEFLLDTGFNGSLLLPAKRAQSLKLQKIAVAEYMLADGSRAVSDVFEGVIDWVGGRKRVAVISGSGDLALLGMELLRDVSTMLAPSRNIIDICELSA